MIGVPGSYRPRGQLHGPERVTLPWTVHSVIERVDGEPGSQSTGDWLIVLALLLLAAVAVWMSPDASENRSLTPTGTGLDAPTQPDADDLQPRDSEAGAVLAGDKAILRASEKVWLRISSESSSPRQMILYRGASLELEVDEPINLWLSNAGAVSLTMRGRSWPSLGPKGARRVLVDPSNLDRLDGA